MDFRRKFKGHAPKQYLRPRRAASSMTTADDVPAALPILTKSDAGRTVRILPPVPTTITNWTGYKAQRNRTMKKSFCTFTWLAVVAIAITAQGQTATGQPGTTYEDGPDGVRYQVTRQVVQRSIPTTEYQAREQKVYHPQVTTEYQSYQQTNFTPVTEYQWVPRLKNRFNPFADAYWTHELTPITRWEARPSTVQVPVARTNWV